MDTKNQNMLSMLSNTNKRLEEFIRITEEKKLENAQTDLEELHEQMENIIDSLPKQIYNFRKRDYAELSHKLEDIIEAIQNTIPKLEQYNMGIDGVVIIAGMSKVRDEVERCIYKARSKAKK